MGCLYLPFIESWFGETLWGLNWKSPMFMHQVSDQLRVVKVIMVILAILLIIIKREKIRATISNKVRRNVFTISGYIFAVVQLPFLLLGVMYEGVSSLDLNYLHKEKTFNERTIYVNTINSGAVGKSYHYFYLKCQLPLNRYELKQIKKVGWMREYSFEMKDNDLIITDKSKNGVSQNFNVTNFSCNA